MAVDAASAAALRQRLAERKSFFGGTMSSREASAVRNWDTMFEDPPQPSAPRSHGGATTKRGQGTGSGKSGGNAGGSVLSRTSTGVPSAADLFREEERSRKRKLAEQMADFDCLDAPSCGGGAPPPANRLKLSHGPVAKSSAGASLQPSTPPRKLQSSPATSQVHQA
eukprot:CAMPEP_0206146524 /NCGR_PEP_ID=MMETSP1473-20131121/30581_1 /ASSEMBLY_ACC=CAM_ASM_001109 /TAXON_ID=1461547 /ORGANISM="Stichococcus sp, Strain RCC1054" /LENGTH=166 /DNA_ID=CAMNT_0053543109 /DNA_START=351 /DNA_END=848 /DNA_ORIENTATION=+